MLAQIQPQQGDIQHWTDIFLADDKRAGYITLANENYHVIGAYGLNDRKRLLSDTNNKIDRFISLNAFNIADWHDIKNVRKANNLKQIRVIGIDIDQYKKGLTIADALDEINRLIDNGMIPTPNMILTSRGIQLFYSIKGGASPYKSGQTSHITNQFIKRLAHIGADGNAKDPARLMRAPYSINSRNGAIVHPQIWNDTSYTLWELLDYAGAYKPEKIKKANIIIPLNFATNLMYRTNKARITDFDMLIELRNGNLTGMRNAFLYNYAFHLSLLDQNCEKVLNKVLDIFSNVSTNDTQGAPFTAREITLTAISAYDDAKAFIQWYQAHNYKLEYGLNDGIIKPKKTSTLIEQLSITISEQHCMTTLATMDILALNRYRETQRQRRNSGMRTMNEYNNDRNKQAQERLQQLKDLIQQHPDYTQKQYADMMNVSRATIARLIKQIK